MDLGKEYEKIQEIGEEENDVNFIKIKSKTRQIIDSDSEGDESTLKQSNVVSAAHFTSKCEENSDELENSRNDHVHILSGADGEDCKELTSKVNNDGGGENTQIKYKKKLKRIAVLGSDSEDESNVNELDFNTDGKQDLSELENNSHKLASELRYESNRENVTELTNVSTENPNKNHDTVGSKDDDNSSVKSKKKRIAILDSNSEDEGPVTPHKSFTDELDAPHESNDTTVYVINEKGKLVAENNTEGSQGAVIKKSCFTALCDSESSEEESRYPTTYENLRDTPPENKKRISKKNFSKTSTNKPSDKKMTAKEALQQRQEIRSESQRMMRESRVSLPYHKPKTHSIKEFLQNRPRLSLSLLKTDSTSPVSIKMTAQQLEVVTKKLEERKKMVQEFYKSETESDEDDFQNEEATTVDSEKNVGDNEELGDNNDNVINEEVKGANSEICCDSVVEGRGEKKAEDFGIQKESIAVPTFDPQGVDIEIVNVHKEIGGINEEGNMETSSINPEITANIEAVVEEMNLELPSMSVENQEISCDINEAQVPEMSNSECEVDKKTTCKGNTVLKIPSEVLDDDVRIRDEISFKDPTKTTESQCEIQHEVQIKNKISLEEPPKTTASQNENQHGEHFSNFMEPCADSVEFDFNLDGINDDILENMPEHAENDFETVENTSPLKEKSTEEEHLQRLLQKYQNVDPFDDCAQAAPAAEKILNKVDLLKQLSATKPSLSGGPDQEIDLEEGVTKPSGVAQLMERFMQHALKKPVVKNKVQLDVINLTQGEVIKETVAMSVEPEEEPIAILETPGLKLKKLRDELQSQIAQRRSELWQQKHQPLGEGLNKETCNEEKSDCGEDEDILDDEEEAELTDDSVEEDDNEYEDEDADEQDKCRVKSAFVDDEAEESDEEECGKASESDIDEKNEEQDTAQDSEDQNIAVRRPLKRILKGFTEDSDDEESSQSILKPQAVENNYPAKNDTSFTSLNSTDTWEDDEVIPPNQPRTDKTPHKEMTQSKSAVLGMLTPVQHLTGLRGFNSGSKFLQQDSPVSLFSLPPEPSPVKGKKWKTDLQKKLFSDSCDTVDSETNMEDISQVCLGKFPPPTLETARADSVCSNTISESLATQDVISICSGTFPGITQAESTVKDRKEKNLSDLPPNEEAILETEALIDRGPVMQVNLTSADEVKSLDDDNLISQLLDEEEMEQFKKKFESPNVPILNLNNTDGYECEMEVKGGGKLVSDSSDDEDEGAKNKKSVKKLQKRLAFSDDSDSEFGEENNGDDEEEIDLHDDVSNEFDDDNTNANKVVDYDSEENEIELDDQEEIPRQKLKPSDFLENEAELSESDWESGDEDEKGLDALEVEQGDADVFDENKIRNDLEKIHMRRVLDQDNREIKILQELLLEDGELHGTGRQRQFRWRNIDDAGNQEEEKDAEIEAFLDEEESEEQWRRARHQREMFLKSKQEKQMVLEEDDFISSDSNSQVLKLGQEVLRKSLSAVSTVTEKPKAAPSSPEVKKPLMFLNTRGSFLARTDKFLTRLAEFTKVTVTASAAGASKTAKKMVFQTVNHTTTCVNTNETTVANKKRKSEKGDETPSIIKKLRLSSTLTPAAKNVDRKKKLFE